MNNFLSTRGWPQKLTSFICFVAVFTLETGYPTDATTLCSIFHKMKEIIENWIKYKNYLNILVSNADIMYQNKI